MVVITGRRAHEVVSLLGIDPHPEIWGAHGLQRLRPDGSCEMPHLDEIATEALAEADSWLDGLGLHHLAEHKPGGLAVHWRGLPAGEQADIRKIVSLGWLPVAHRAGMVFQEFDGGVEMRMPDRNKGDAVRTILSELSPETPVAYLGDDETDEDAFAHCRIAACEFWCVHSGGKPQPMYGLDLRLNFLAFLCDWMEACRNAERPPHSTGYAHGRQLREGIDVSMTESSVAVETQAPASPKAFFFNTSAHLLRIGRERATTLTELLQSMRSCSEGSIFQHTFRTLQEHHFIREGFSNDFALWTFTACNERGLAERLASIDVREFTSVQGVREQMVHIVEEYVQNDPTERGSTSP